MVTWSALSLLALTISLAEGSEPDAPAAAEPAGVLVRAAAGVDLPPSLAEDVRAAVENALLGRTRPAVPIEVTLGVGAVDVRVGSLARRVAVFRWDEVALRTIALHVLDLMQPAPEVGAIAAPTESLAAAPPPAETPPAPPVWSVRAGAAASKGAENDNPWVFAFAAGGAWTHDWLRLGAEMGWERTRRHQVYNLAPASYDAWPFRLSAAAQAGMLEAGLRAGVEVFRVTTDRSNLAETPLAGAFVGIRLPATPWLHGVLVGGADVMPRRIQVTVGGATPYTTPRLAPYVGMVVEVGVNP
jgi:hypothetical protein